MWPMHMLSRIWEAAAVVDVTGPGRCATVSGGWGTPARRRTALRGRRYTSSHYLGVALRRTPLRGAPLLRCVYCVCDAVCLSS